MDLLLVLLSATVLTVLGLVADRVDRDLRGGARAADRTDRDVIGDRPMRLELLGQGPADPMTVQATTCSWLSESMPRDGPSPPRWRGGRG